MPSLLDPMLDYFVLVAEHSSFSAAAKAAHVSQPSVSVAVKKLEEDLGVALFQRHARGVLLTRAGDQLLARAREATRALRAARDEITSLNSEPRGNFVLGCHESLGTYFLPGFMGRFLERYPDITLTLFNANSEEVERCIEDREIDLGLVVNPKGYPNCIVRDLFADRVTFVVARKLARKAHRDAELLERRPLYFVPELKQAQGLLAMLEGQGIQVGRKIGCSSLELVKSLVLDGAGVGILPFRVASHGVAEGRLRPLSKAFPDFADRITLTWRADTPMTAGLRTVIDSLLAHGKGLPSLPTELRDSYD